jgi:hypothetical protein
MRIRHFVYCETLPFEEVMRRETVALLSRYRLSIVLAVRPWQLEGLPRVAGMLADAGVPLSLWPMLSDDEGRWASAANAASFSDLLRRTADAARAPFAEMLVDLEPPFAQARALATSLGPDGGYARRAEHPESRLGGVRGRSPLREIVRLRTRARDAFAAAERHLAAAMSDLSSRGVTSAAAVWPLVALDARRDDGWQRVLGTPVDGIPLSRVSVMAYTSILEGWSRGTLGRRHAQALLAGAARRAVRRWGDAGGISLGCVGTGAFEDEPIYRSPRELAEDVAIARAEGSIDLSLFDLGGVLARPPAEAWLDAFTSEPSAIDPPRSRRVAAARTLARAATWALARRRAT